MKEICLKDYQPPRFLIDEVELSFDIYENETIVRANLNVKRNGDHFDPLVLDGEDLELRYIKLDNAQVLEDKYVVTDNSLTIYGVPKKFTLQTEVKIVPENNTQLSGLYKSGELYCTQCESHGFRRITYFLDRPDNLAHFTVKILASNDHPILLSNGNLIEEDSSKDGRHWVKWKDPSLKPSYLFALVAGNLEFIEDTFTTCSGREILLRIYAEKGRKNRCRHAMESLKQAMKWDEDVFGREYDLDIYMIVAVEDFNAGAMENKGLNIFSSKYIFADKNTATDDDYINIANVVAHEYFHNWTGNRVTCRDWFQITLKEGLTMFRDQLFTEDMTSHAVRRIQEANTIRSVQFSEDAGPMAHPPQPCCYIAMDNFYTLTVYHKGAEIVRMLYTMLGKDLFRKGMDIYFKKNDGKAITINEFLQAMEDGSGVALGQFKKWYKEKGTPWLNIESSYDENRKEYKLTIEQDRDFHIPVATGLLDKSGNDIVSDVLNVKKKTQQFIFKDVAEKPVLSILRDFSAPVKLNYQYSNEELLFLMRHDNDPFNQWNAAQQLAVKFIFSLINDYQKNRKLVIPETFIEVYRDLIANTEDRFFAALLLTLPTQSYLIELSEVADIDALFYVHEFIKTELAKNLSGDFLYWYNKLPPNSMANRKFRNLCLHYLMYLEDKSIIKLCESQLYNADNMTDAVGALEPLANADIPERIEALEYFYNKWKDESLVVNKWLEIQAASKLPDTLVQVKSLVNTRIFDIKNPSKVYALIRTFASLNHVRFHDASGAGYEFLANQVMKLDKLNPSVAARVVEPLIHWRKPSVGRQHLMYKQLMRIKKMPQLSKNLYEVVSKAVDS